MDFRNRYGFDPEAYDTQGSGGLLSSLETMMGQQRGGPDPGSCDGSEYAPTAYGGAISVLRADPSTPVSQLLDSNAMAANPFLRNMTAGDLRAWADRKMEGGSQTRSSPVPPRFPDRAAPIFPRRPQDGLAIPAAERRTGDISSQVSPGMDVASGEDFAPHTLPGLVSGLPMQYWPLSLFDTRR